jgi:hypothetical protein
MTRAQLEHLIRAAAATANVKDIVVIGSQAVLGTHPKAPGELLFSMEADVFPKDEPTRSIVIDGAIGEEPLFHQTFGYYAHGVDDTTAVLPDGWRDRLVKLANANTMGAVGWCLEIHDLAVSKLIAGREKDLQYLDALVRDDLVDMGTIRERLLKVPSLSSAQRQLAMQRLDARAPDKNS